MNDKDSQLIFEAYLNEATGPIIVALPYYEYTDHLIHHSTTGDPDDGWYEHDGDDPEENIDGDNVGVVLVASSSGFTTVFLDLTNFKGEYYDSAEMIPTGAYHGLKGTDLTVEPTQMTPVELDTAEQQLMGDAETVEKLTSIADGIDRDSEEMPTGDLHSHYGVGRSDFE